MREQVSRANKIAWETGAYQAWVHAYRSPNQLAEDLKQNHAHHLRYWLKYIGNPMGKRVLNLLGSHGRKAISLALMGADVTVVDISEENRMYATQVANAAGVKLNYICSDALNIPDENSLGHFDIVLMEFGILHYFTDLNAIFSVVSRRLDENGRYLLTDFHPLAKVRKDPTLSYFDDTTHEGPVAFSMLLPETDCQSLNPTVTRSWTLGAIITSIASLGLFIRAFEEIPTSQDPTFPEFYTLVVDKADGQFGLTPIYP